MEWRMPNHRIGVEMKEGYENEEIGLAMGERSSGFSFVFS